MTIDAVDALRLRAGTLRETALEERLHYLDVDCRILTRRVVRPGVTAAFLVVAPSGVWVLGARRYEGRPSPQGGALSRRTQILQLGGRSATRLVAGVARQADAVQAELGAHVPVSAMLCVLDADWPIFGGSFTVDGVRVLWPKKACEVIETGHRLGTGQINDIHDQLATAFPVAPNRHGMRTHAN
jgi:hypothetical protein